MIWSGILIYWANAVYRVGIGDWTLVRMTMAQAAYRKLHINNRLAEGMGLHFFFMWLFIGNGVAYVAYTLISGEWRELVPNRKSFREAWHVLLHDLHLRREPPPPRKFNGAQQIAYTSVIFMGLGSLLTGLVALFGGYPLARFFHFWLTVGYVLFFLVHIAQVIRAGWNNFRAMVIGYEVHS
jgi:thiosulfate reductase cytochrome b subunit